MVIDKEDENEFLEIATWSQDKKWKEGYRR